MRRKIGDLAHGKKNIWNQTRVCVLFPGYVRPSSTGQRTSGYRGGLRGDRGGLRGYRGGLRGDRGGLRGDRGGQIRVRPSGAMRRKAWKEAFLRAQQEGLLDQ
jgi:hypothetical protein